MGWPFKSPRYVGKPVPRVEDRRFVTGNGVFVDDLRLPGMLYAAFVRSRVAHARIRSIETSKAEKLNGVVAVLTAKDVDRLVGPVATDGGKEVPRAKPLASGKVRYYGEPVAMVIAEDRYLAYDAAELVEVEYERLEPVTDVEEALREGAPLVHEELGSNVAFTYRKAGGDVEEAFGAADVVRKYRFRIQRLAAVPMETRGVVAEYEKATGRLVVHATHQFPHDLRRWTAEALGIPLSDVRVVVHDVGGAFGSKITHYPEDVLVPLAAKLLGKPVKWIESRSESLTSSTQGRGIVADVEVAAKSNGRLLGARLRVLGDVGAYLFYLTKGPFTNVLNMFPGAYKLKGIEGEVIGVYTNKVPAGPYRGAGRPEASYLIERTVERLARELGIDPAELRAINFVRKDEFPYRTVTGQTYDSGDYEAALRKALDLLGYKQMRGLKERARAEGKLVGIGLSAYVEVCNFASQSAKVKVDEDGKVTVYTSTMPHGQGEQTAFAQLVADFFGIGMEDVRVFYGDTDLAPEGGGTAGSWTLTSGGAAILAACERVKEKMVRVAANLLEANPDDVVMEGGRFYVRGHEERALEFREVAAAAYDEDALPEDIEPGLEAYAFHSPKLTYPFGAHAVVVEVDPETFQVRILKAVMVDDCGNVVNPLLVEGQLIGGAVQALGQALYEEVVYDNEGQLVTATLTDYLIPTAVEVPRLELDRTVTPAPNPLGTKGVGEAATIGFAQAVMNAIEDALWPLRIDGSPAKPSYLWEIARSR